MLTITHCDIQHPRGHGVPTLPGCALFIYILDRSLLFLPFRLPEDTLPLFKMLPPLRRLGQVSLFYVGHIRPYALDFRVFFAGMEGNRPVENRLGSVPGVCLLVPLGFIGVFSCPATVAHPITLANHRRR